MRQTFTPETAHLAIDGEELVVRVPNPRPDECSHDGTVNLRGECLRCARPADVEGRV